MTLLAEYPVLAVILFIGFLVFVHETGHFLVGKAFGIGAEVYSIGFGPALIRFTYKGTEYRLSLLPLGGFVKFAGRIPSEEVPECFRGKEMYRASALARAATLLAGPAANLLLAAVVYAVFGYQGVQHPPALVGMVIPGGAAEKGGLHVGDKVLAIDGQPVRHWDELREKIAGSAGDELNLSILRDEKTIRLVITPEATGEDEDTGVRGQGRLGISFGMIPSVVTMIPVEGKDGPAAEAGMQTGDRITEVSWKQQSHPVKTWHDFVRQLELAHVEQADSLDISFQRVSEPGAVASDPSPSQKTSVRRISLDTRAWSESDFMASRGRVSFLNNLAAALGLSDSQLTLGEVLPPLDTELQSFDKILAFNGVSVGTLFDFHDLIKDQKEPAATVSVLRDGQVIEKNIRMEPTEVQRASGKVLLYTFSARLLGQAEAPEPVTEVYDNFFSASAYGIKEAALRSATVVTAIWGLISGDLPLKSLGGPMLIAKVAGDAAEAGIKAFFAAMAIISVNLGVLNLFPIPALDGGQLLLVGAEVVRRRPLSEAAVEHFQSIGFVMIMALFVLATYNDLSRFWSSMLKGMEAFFN
ncbi:MAG: RIP metalloprotease RseP [Deltaproteobacteria bacterium]|nr:RIP metalloprotease RseP [Deltaproteobacteria bacterium]